jgi:hypothetical protein
MADKVEYYMINNWDKYQHYKKRNPTWIKLYVSILNDMEFRKLRDQSKLILVHLYLLAAVNNNRLDLTPALLARTCGIRVRHENIAELKESGFLVPCDASKIGVECYTEKSQRREREEKRREEIPRENHPQTCGSESDSPSQISYLERVEELRRRS